MTFDSASHPEKAPSKDGAKPLVGVTMGDPAGIGAEVIVKALVDPDIRALGRFVILGVEETLAAAADESSIRPFWFRIRRGEPLKIDTGVVVMDFDEYTAGHWIIARPTAEGGRASIAFVDRAIEAALAGTLDAIVTAPINKESWKLAGRKNPGHTERLAEACHVKRVTMTFVGGGLVVALASVHTALFDLRNKFTIGLVFQPIDLLATALKNWFGIAEPRIAVAALNPHAGENGRFGDEEKRVIEPAIQMARNHGIAVEGPFAADTLFTPRRRSRFDGIVAMYHDQGLIPIKMLAFDTAVNVTLGLPIIRTSVDHGTAFDIAGTGVADPGSMKEAIRLACRLSRISSATEWPAPQAIQRNV